MQSQSMTATEFRDELRRLKLSQTAFAERAGTPLRTVQSWANGERAIPNTVSSIISKIESADMVKQIASVLETKSVKAVEAVANVVFAFGKEAKKLADLEASHRELLSEFKKLRADFDALNETCVFQAKKITAYAKDDERRANGVKPFNA